MICDILAIVNLAIFFVGLFVVKKILDSEQFQQRFPFMRTYLFRACLVGLVIGPLAKAVEPDQLAIAYLLSDVCFFVVMCIAAWWYLRHRLPV